MVMILTNEELKLKRAKNMNETEVVYLLPDSTKSFLLSIFNYDELS